MGKYSFCDNQFVKPAIAGDTESAITANTKDLATAELVSDQIRVGTAGNWLKEENRYGDVDDSAT